MAAQNAMTTGPRKTPRHKISSARIRIQVVGGNNMLDVVFVVVAIAFLWVSLLYVRAAEKL